MLLPPGLQEEAGAHVVVRIDELELVVVPARDVDAPGLVVVGVELQRPCDLQALQVEVAPLDAHAGVAAVVVAAGDAGEIEDGVSPG